jgi:phospholipase C
VSLPFVTATVGEAHSYHPVPASDVMPVQEAGSKRARALPYQPNASLAGFAAANGAVTARLLLSNSGPHTARSSHFSVYDNTLTTAPGIAAYPAAFPGQYTVPHSAHKVETVTATGPVAASGAYDLTVTGPNRFLRRFTGNAVTAGAGVAVTADYFADGWGPHPVLTLTLANNGHADVTFTVTANQYAAGPARTYRVHGGKHASHAIDPIVTAHGWYDVTVTIDADASWSQRFTGHLENGQPSITG